MPVTAFRAWDHAGRPITPAQPIRELVAALKSKFPRAASIFGWYADETHYEAAPAGDHTPYSSDAWPVTPNPQWVVFATDVMHRVDLGVDCRVLGPYWLAEARAGRMPWLKYLIWQGHIYDVRHGWRPQSAVGHFDHVHLSARTDHLTTGLGSWSITPGGRPAVSEGDDGVTEQPVKDQISRIELTLGSFIQGLARTVPQPGLAGNPTYPIVPNAQLAQIVAASAADEARDAAMVAAVNAIGARLGTQSPAGGQPGAPPDLGPVIAAIRDEGTRTRGIVAELQAQLTAREQELAALRAAVAGALTPSPA